MMRIESWLLSYLLNALWQAPLVFATGWLAARALRRLGAAAEHRLWVGVLALESILPALSAASWDWLLALLAPGRAGGESHVTVILSEGTAVGAVPLPGAILTAVALFYCATLVYFAARLAWQWNALRVLRNDATPMTLTGEAALSWLRCADRFGVECATVARSSHVAGPLTIGLRNKLLLLPATMATTLSDAEMQTVLAHEFAHMRRNDFAKNIAYELLSIPMRFHPACWLVRRRITETRELVCDAMAAAIGGRTYYARSLLRLAAGLVAGSSVRTPQAIGIFDTTTFERRVMRLTETQREVKGARRLAIAAVCAALAVGTCASALALRMHVDAAAVGVGAGNGEASTPITVPAKEMVTLVLKKVPPVYPPDAKKARVQGAVELSAVIGKDGSVEDLKVLSGPKMLRQSALDAVRQWTYKPYLLNGEPVEVNTKIHIIYSLSK